jgi:hypothetical protein
MELKRITSASINDIRRSIETGSPISEYILFYNDHDAVAQHLRDLISFASSHSIGARFFELEEDENFQDLSHPAQYEISSETLINILDQHEQGLLRQLNG